MTKSEYKLVLDLTVFLLLEINSKYKFQCNEILYEYEKEFNEKYSGKSVVLEFLGETIYEKIKEYNLSLSCTHFVCTHNYVRQYFGDRCDLL